LVAKDKPELKSKEMFAEIAARWKLLDDAQKSLFKTVQKNN
jgi:hypothetical protein